MAVALPSLVLDLTMSRFGAILLATFGAIVTAAQHSSPDAGLDRLREAYAGAYNRGDSAAIGAMYADSAVRMPYDTPAQLGKAAILIATARGFSARKFKPTLTLIPEGVIRAADTAIERGLYHELQEFADGRSAREDGKYVFVAVRERGGWKYLWSIFNRDAAAHQ